MSTFHFNSSSETAPDRKKYQTSLDKEFYAVLAISSIKIACTLHNLNFEKTPVKREQIKILEFPHTLS